MGRTETRVKCTSIFKGGKNAISKDLFTRQWIELIDQMEKEKGAGTVRQQKL